MTITLRKIATNLNSKSNIIHFKMIYCCTLTLVKQLMLIYSIDLNFEVHQQLIILFNMILTTYDKITNNQV